MMNVEFLKKMGLAAQTCAELPNEYVELTNTMSNEDQEIGTFVYGKVDWYESKAGSGEAYEGYVLHMSNASKVVFNNKKIVSFAYGIDQMDVHLDDFHFIEPTTYEDYVTNIKNLLSELGESINGMFFNKVEVGQTIYKVTYGDVLVGDGKDIRIEQLVVKAIREMDDEREFRFTNNKANPLVIPTKKLSNTSFLCMDNTIEYFTLLSEMTYIVKERIRNLKKITNNIDYALETFNKAINKAEN